MNRESDNGFVCGDCGETVFKDQCACDVRCSDCGHARSEHSEEMPYECMNQDICDCPAFSYVSPNTNQTDCTKTSSDQEFEDLLRLAYNGFQRLRATNDTKAIAASNRNTAFLIGRLKGAA